MEKTTLYLPDDLQRALRSEARRSGRPQAELVRAALRAYLEGRPKPRLRSIAAGEDALLAGRDSERWLAREWGRS
jgi:predicted transcriptional regulator